VVCHKLNDALLRNVPMHIYPDFSLIRFTRCIIQENKTPKHGRENVLLISGNLQLGMGATLLMYEAESYEKLKLHVASGAAIFTLLLRRRVAFLHRTATCRPLFKPSVSLLSTYRQSSCVSNFIALFKVYI